MSKQAGDLACPRCGMPLSADALACSKCGGLLYGSKLEQLSAEARWQEQFNPTHAIELWQQCLQLLPAHSRQRQIIATEINRLSDLPPAEEPMVEPGAPAIPRGDTLASGWWKTVLSMAVSVAVYCAIWSWPQSVGFVLLILIHELGHTLANVYLGIPASAPLFIPLIGAVINVRGGFPNAKVEAISAIAGPIAGSVASLSCFGWYWYDGSDLALWLAWWGFTNNLFNLLPIPPLDGGRVAAAMSPWIWIIGLIGIAIMVLNGLREKSLSGILIIVLIVALPRIKQALTARSQTGLYYAVHSSVRFAVSASYLLLVGFLLAARWYSRSLMTISPF